MSAIFYVIVTFITIIVNAVGSASSFARAKFITDNLTEVNIPPSWLPVLATLQGAGALGLLLGLIGVPVLGPAAATGLVLYFTGAVITHTRAGAYRSLSSPMVFLALAATTLVLMAGR